jgi:type VI protein secretion system component VasF
MEHELSDAPKPSLHQRERRRRQLLMTARAALLLAGGCVLLLGLEENITVAGTPAHAEVVRWPMRCVLLGLAALFFGYAVGVEVGVALSD